MAGVMSKYAFINANLRAKISCITPKDMFARLEKAPSLEAGLALLRNGPFAELERIYSTTADIKQAELYLLKNEIKLYNDILKHIDHNPGRLVKAMLAGFETDNLKNVIRFYFNRKIHGHWDENAIHYLIYERIINDIPVDMIANAESLEEIARLCGKTPYGAIIKQYSGTVDSEKSLFRLEIAIDHFYYSHLLFSAGKLNSLDRKIAMRLIGVEIDLQNISWIIRFKNFYNISPQQVMDIIIPGGFGLKEGFVNQLYSSQDVAEAIGGFVKKNYPAMLAFISSQAKSSDSISRLRLIDAVLEEVRKQEVRRALGGYPFTIGIVLAYFLLKRDELKKLRTVLNSKLYGKSHRNNGSLIYPLG